MHPKIKRLRKISTYFALCQIRHWCRIWHKARERLSTCRWPFSCLPGNDLLSQVGGAFSILFPQRARRVTVHRTVTSAVQVRRRVQYSFPTARSPRNHSLDGFVSALEVLTSVFGIRNTKVSSGQFRRGGTLLSILNRRSTGGLFRPSHTATYTCCVAPAYGWDRPQSIMHFVISFSL